MTNFDIVRAACINANPEVATRFVYPDKTLDKIRLADVLLAIGKKEDRDNTIIVSDGGEIGTWNIFKTGPHYWQHIFWNLRIDDLAQQSEETLAFLSNLLK